MYPQTLTTPIQRIQGFGINTCGLLSVGCWGNSSQKAQIGTWTPWPPWRSESRQMNQCPIKYMK